jgi:CopG family transcriptional regulator, nickel-responsive regulator
MKGRSKEVQAMADKLIATRGVELGKLVLTNSGVALRKHKH